MFGLTKREQRWKAEQRAAEVLAALAGTAMKAAAEVRVAEAQADAAELARLRTEAASFQMAYRLKCDEETKAQAVEIERLRALCLDYAMACGELSKALPEGDPMWAQLKALGERIGA
jgi:hypothetical protein